VSRWEGFVEKEGFEPWVKEWWMMKVVMMTEMSWQVNEEVSRDTTGEADEMNQGVDSRDWVMHIWMSDHCLDENIKQILNKSKAKWLACHKPQHRSIVITIKILLNRYIYYVLTILHALHKQSPRLCNPAYCGSVPSPVNLVGNSRNGIWHKILGWDVRFSHSYHLQAS